MKRILSYIFILAVMLNFTACEDGNVMWDDANKFVAFTSGTASFPEQDGGGTIEVMIAGLDGAAGTVTLEVSVEGIDKPATEGTDFSLSTTQVSFPNGSGIVSIDVDVVDNDVFTGNRQFKIKISSNSLGLPVGAAKEMIVTLIDNEHPLATWIGTYAVAAVSYGSPGDWDEAWTVSTVPNPDDVNQLIISGLSYGDIPVVATLDKDNMTITIPGATPVATSDSNFGYNATWYYANSGIWSVISGYTTASVLEDAAAIDFVGTLKADGTIELDNVTPVLDDYVYIWDIFNTTWTKQ